MSLTKNRFAQWVYRHFPASATLGWLLCRKFYHRPVLIVAVGRSGTAVLAKALEKHPMILSAGEGRMFPPIGDIVYQHTQGPAHQHFHGSLPLKEVFRRLRRLLFEWQLGSCYGFRFLFLNRLILHRMRVMATRRWITKSRPMLKEAQGLVELYPDIRFLYLHRNGLDNVQSRTKFSGFREASFREHCETWANGVEKFAYLMDHPNACLISHSDIVERREDTFRRVIEFLDLPHNDLPAKYAAETIVHPLDRPTQKATDIEDALRSRPPAYESWTEEQRQTFKEVCGDAMVRLGYDVPF